MKKQLDKFQVVEDVKKVSKIFKKEFPNSKEFITRDYYRSHGEYGKSIDKIFGSFKNALSEIFKINSGKGRDEINVCKVAKNIKGKRFFVSAIIAGEEVDEKYFKSIETYAEKQNAEIVLLTMRGISNKARFSDDIIKRYGKYFCTEYNFNSNLKAIDFLLVPSQIVSLTGISRMSKKNQSLIVAHSKLSLEVLPSRIGDYPSLTYSTGCINNAKYKQDRIGKIASLDHCKSGLIIEIENDKKFYIRTIQADKFGGFVDLGIYYRQNDISKMKSSIVLGDSHFSSEDKIAHKAAKEIIEYVGCKKVYFNDLFDCQSVSHHLDKNLFGKYQRDDYQKKLEDELLYLGKCLEDFCKHIEDRQFISIPSNHTEHLIRYMTEGRFTQDIPENAKLACELFVQYLEGSDPIYYFLKSRKFKIPKILFPKREDAIIESGYDIIHGDFAQNGTKGNIKSFDRSFNKSISAHTHTPKIFRDSVSVGCLCKLQQNYNKKCPSSWLHNVGVVYENSTFQLINIINGIWKLS